MIEFISQSDKSSLILFIHGFTGDEDTWTNSGTGAKFPELLLENDEIWERFDVAHFSYYTKLLNLFAKAGNLKKLIRSVFPASHGKLKKNISVSEVSNLLRTEIRFNLQQYDNIVIVAHSMGGLVAKSCIVNDLNEDYISKIKLFISLAVPHMGANAATFGSLISGNLQIEDLTPLNKFIHEINDSWLKASLRPRTAYFYGVHDGVVDKTSAAPIDKEKSDIISVDDNHTSISRPSLASDTVCVAVTKIILDYKQTDPATSEIQFQSLSDDEAYEDELFVLKMIIADIHHSSIKDAKEMFLNAEYIRKKFSGESDQLRLADLYKKVRKIYRDNYTSFQHEGIANSGQLLAKVNSDITTEDKKFLKAKFLPFLNAIHKQGMLQQLANVKAEDIWWTKETGIEFLEECLRETPDE